MSFNLDWRQMGVCSLVLLASVSNAEIVLDDGATTLTGDMVIGQDMGITRGGNLLHTFLEFNVNSGESATFTGESSITNIIARVTGDNSSTISGLIRSTISDANLFLINPNGIAMTAGAEIDISGGLYLSSGTGLRFEDDSVLLVSDTGASSLTTAAPSAFGFSANPEAITFDGVEIGTSAGSQLNGLHVFGGDIELSESSIQIESGSIELVAMQGAGEVAIDSSLRNYGSLELGSISISNAEYLAGKRDLDTSGESAGQIHIAGGTVDIDTALVFADTSGSGDGGAIEVVASEGLHLSGGARITSDTTGPGDGGNIIIQSPEVLLEGTQTSIAASTLGLGGQAGDVEVVAQALRIEDGAQIAAVSSSSSNGGAIAITTETLLLTSGGRISGQAANRGDGANIVINATEFVAIDAADQSNGDISAISVASLNGRPFFQGGDSGNVSITTPKLSVVNGGLISASAPLRAAGAPGSIELNVTELVVDNGGQITTLVGSAQPAGTISVDAVSVTITGLGSSLNSTTRGEGSGGAILITSGTFMLADGGVIDTSTLAEGQAGKIIIESDSVNLQGAGTLIASQSEGSGLGGSISLMGSDLSLIGGASLSVTATGAGDAGDISLVASNRLDVLDGSAIETNALASGGGNVDVQVIDTIYLRDSTLTASAGGIESGDNGGNITIDPIFLILDNASIVAQAFAGNGGLIQLSTENYIADTNSFIDASSELGNDGEVRVSSLDNSVTGVIGTLSAELETVSALTTSACAARNVIDRSTLVITENLGELSAPGDLNRTGPADC